MNIKIIFLDIDGVLHDKFKVKVKYPHRLTSLLMKKAGVYYYLSQVDFYNLHCVFPKETGRTLFRLCKRYQIGVVLTTSWLRAYDNETARQEILKAYYSPLSDYYAGSVDTSLTKAAAIRKWLSDNNYLGRYVVLDDDNLDIENQVLVKAHRLSRNDVRQLKQYLKIT